MGRRLRWCNRCQVDASYITSDFCINRDCVWISVFSFSCNEDITSGCDIIRSRSVRNLSSDVQIRHLLEVDFVCLLDVRPMKPLRSPTTRRGGELLALICKAKGGARSTGSDGMLGAVICAVISSNSSRSLNSHRSSSSSRLNSHSSSSSSRLNSHSSNSRLNSHTLVSGTPPAALGPTKLAQALAARQACRR